MNLKVSQREDFALVEIEIPGGVASPEELKSLEIPTVDNSKGVVISGRAPVWAFAHLVHEFHPVGWVGTFDPRLNGAIVVSRHTPDAPQIGEVYPCMMT